MRTDYELLGGAAVYPGHPVTIAYCMVNNFDSWEAASAKGKEFPGALEATEIPGAGGCVYRALQLLRELRDGMEPKEAFERADASWGRTDGMEDKQDSFQRWQDGLRQAEPLKQKLLEDMHQGWVGSGVVQGMPNLVESKTCNCVWIAHDEQDH